MRLILGLVVLIGLFAVLVRLLPASWGLPLYVLFLVATISFVVRERRAIGARRKQLERELRRSRAARDIDLRERQQATEEE